MSITAATLFSGIGAPEVAMPGWDWAWHAEIEKFPSAVMAARHPQSVNLGDVSADDFTDRAGAIARPDVIVFGSPCQSYSVAGKRLGLADPRGNLALVALGVIKRLKPRWFTFENVPGLLSSAEGRDFGLFLRTVDELGYSLAWTVLDAQHFGVAQRRQRVFAVGYIGDWRYPAAVLLEPESLRGHHPPRREKGEGTSHPIAPSLTSSGRGVERPEETRGQDPVIAVCGALNSSSGHAYPGQTIQDAMAGQLIPQVSHALNAGGMGRQDYETETLIAQPQAFYSTESRCDTFPDAGLSPPLKVGSNGGGQPPAIAFKASHYTRGKDGAPAVTAPPLSADADKGDQDTLIAFDTTHITGPGNYSNPQPGDPCHPVTATAHVPAIAFSCKDHGADAGDLAPTLRAMGHAGSHANAGGQVAVAVDVYNQSIDGETAATLNAESGAPNHSGPKVMVSAPSIADTLGVGANQTTGFQTEVASHGSAVRRLTPRECERLQGFPDDFTLVNYRGKPAADGPRYKALGNSMAVPVVRWILSRIEQVDAMGNERLTK